MMCDKEFERSILENCGEEAYRQYCRYVMGAGSFGDFIKTIEASFPLPSKEEIEKIADAINEVRT